MNSIYALDKVTAYNQSHTCLHPFTNHVVLKHLRRTVPHHLDEDEALTTCCDVVEAEVVEEGKRSGDEVRRCGGDVVKEGKGRVDVVRRLYAFVKQCFFLGAPLKQIKVIFLCLPTSHHSHITFSFYKLASFSNCAHIS